MVKGHGCDSKTHRVTPCIFGISFGSRMAYETPLKVVPTSNARTREREFPLYGLRVSLVMAMRGRYTEREGRKGDCEGRREARRGVCESV